MYLYTTNQNVKSKMSNIRCPKCGSEQIHAGNKGFSAGKAVAGTLLAGPIVGGIAGASGSGKVKLTCLKCGHTFYPGDKPTQLPQAKWTKRSFKRFILATAIMVAIGIYIALNYSLWLFVIALIIYAIACVGIIEKK